MNWKLLLIALSVIVLVNARPADEVITNESVVKSTDSITTEEPQILTTLESVKETPIEVKTTRAQQLTTPRSLTRDVTAATTTTTTTDRYLSSTIKETNARTKYAANNYANLITKHNNNKLIINNISHNISSISDKNLILTLHDIENSLSSLPVATTSSSTTSNSSSNLLTFVDADNESIIYPTTPIIKELTTTSRAFVPLKKQQTIGTWSNYHVEPPKEIPTKIKKSVIHKIISKWSDNPNDVFNFDKKGQLPTTQQSQISDLKQQLLLGSFNNVNNLASNPNHNFDQLPFTYGQQLLQQHLPSAIGTTNRPSPPSPVTNHINIITKRPSYTGSSVKPYYQSDSYENVKQNGCGNVKIQLSSTFNNGAISKENCNDIEIQISNIANTMLDNQSVDDINDKLDDPVDDYDASVETEDKQQGTPNDVLNGGSGGNGKRKKKKHGGGGGDSSMMASMFGSVGSTMIAMMTMMAVFNPMNLGLWGLVMSPMAAMLFGGICFAMYSFMNHPAVMSSGHHHMPWSPPPSKPIVIRNKIKHSPIPIHILHHHKTSVTHTRASPPKHSYGPPIEVYEHPMDAYGPPPIKNSYGAPPKDTYGAPPMTSSDVHPMNTFYDDYHPQASSHEDYYNRAGSSKKKNSYKFKLL
ncbi:unnamed protein product [Diamesa tonsa]